MTVIVWVDASYPAIETLSDWIWTHSPLVSLERSVSWPVPELSVIDDGLLDSAEHDEAPIATENDSAITVNFRIETDFTWRAGVSVLTKLG